MKLYNIVDVSTALCNKRKNIVPTSFQLRHPPLSDGSEVVNAVLVSVCTDCGQIVSSPEQSLTLVQDTIRKSKDSVEACASVAVDDLLKTACPKARASNEFQVTMIRYYAHSMVKENSYSAELTKVINRDIAHSKTPAGFRSKAITLKPILM